jgi:hypothetical protein
LILKRMQHFRTTEVMRPSPGTAAIR